MHMRLATHPRALVPARRADAHPLATVCRYTYNGVVDLIPPIQGDAPLPAICGSGIANLCQ